MASNDMFAPPKQEELDQFAPPSEQELAMFAPPEPEAASESGPPTPETKPSGGFLGADLSSLAGTDSAENLADAVQGLSTGVIEGARSVPIAGPVAEELALWLTGEDPEAFKQRREAAKQESPIASTAGEIAGSVGGFMAAPQAVLPQMVLGAGDVALRGGDGQEIATTAALTGAAGAGGALLKRLSKVADKMKAAAGRQAEKAAGLKVTKSLRDRIARMESTGSIKSGELGERLLDEGVVQAGDTAQAIADKAKDLKERAGAEIGQLLQGKQTPTQVAKDLLQGKLDGTALSELQMKIQKKINTQIDLLDEAGDQIDLETLRKIKTEIRKEVKDFTSEAPTKEAGKKMYKALTESIEFSLDDKALEKLRTLNKKYQAATMAEASALSHANREPSELGKYLELFGVASGNPVLPTVVASKSVWRRYGSALAAAGLKKGASLGKYADRFAEAAEKGPAAVNALHFNLVQTDPAYRKKHGVEK